MGHELVHVVGICGKHIHTKPKKPAPRTFLWHTEQQVPVPHENQQQWAIHRSCINQGSPAESPTGTMQRTGTIQRVVIQQATNPLPPAMAPPVSSRGHNFMYLRQMFFLRSGYDSGK